MMCAVSNSAIWYNFSRFPRYSCPLALRSAAPRWKTISGDALEARAEKALSVRL